MGFLINSIALFFVTIGRLFTTLFDTFSRNGQAISSTSNNPRRGKKAAVITLSLVVIVASLCRLASKMSPSSSPVNTAPFTGLGQVLAEETIKSINDHGNVVPIIADLQSPDNAIMAREWETFAAEIKKHSGVTLAKPVIVKLGETIGKPGISRTEFDNLVGRFAHADALVMFVGLPMWDPENPVTLPHIAPKIIVVQKDLMPVRPFFDSSVVKVLITPHMTPPAASTGEPKSPREWFDKYYQVCTVENYQSLPN